jgi:NADPH-dependent 2,4-dienoyl-CoA reductase/sulfur reductase-like enzyme
VRAELERNGVTVFCERAVTGIEASAGELRVATTAEATLRADLVLVVTGVRPDVELALGAGVKTGFGGAIAVDTAMRTNQPDVFAAGDCAHTHHRLLAEATYLPLGTTAHKQGRVAGENAIGGDASYAGSLGTQVVRVFDLVAAATGLRDTEAAAAGYRPSTVSAIADDHKIYYPGATPISQRITADVVTRKLLGAQLVGHVSAEISKRVDVLSTTASLRLRARRPARTPIEDGRCRPDFPGRDGGQRAGPCCGCVDLAPSRGTSSRRCVVADTPARTPEARRAGDAGCCLLAPGGERIVET